MIALDRLNTIEDVKGFVARHKSSTNGNGNGESPGPLVQSQVGLIREIDTDHTETNGLRGYVMKTTAGTVFQASLKKELCEQFIVTHLVRDLFKAPAQDYTEVREKID